jgi:hypothetical protein
MSPTPFEGRKVNPIKHRGDPKWAILQSGHRVEKQERLFFRIPVAMGHFDAHQWVSIKTADYHSEHFLYLDPLYESDEPEDKGHWFCMCSCGSPAVLVGPTDAQIEDSGIEEQLLVCYTYHLTLTETGFGRHATTGERPWA